MRTTTAAGAIAIAVVLGITGCSASGGAPMGASGESAGEAGRGGGALVEESAASPGEDLAVDPDASGRAVVTTGSVTVSAAHPIEAAADAVRIVERAGGRVDDRREYSPEDGDGDGGEGSASLTLRIPSAELTAVLDELRGLGTAQEVSIGSEDVTTASADLDARISALSASIDRLTSMIGKAAKTSDLIELETAIGSRQAELESLQAQRRSLDDQVAMSTIHLELVSVAVATAQAPPEGPGTFVEGLLASLDGMRAVGAGLLVAAGVLLPWLVVLGGLALGAVALIRRIARRTPVARPAPAGAGGEAPPVS